jgi:hypothetical protein
VKDKKEVKKMASKAYLMVVVAEDYLKDGCEKILKDLKTIPEVRGVEKVMGTNDLLVQVEVPLHSWTVFAADKVLAKEWTKRLQVLNVEHLGFERYVESREETVVRAATR